MHFIAFTCREWKPNSLGRYGTNSSASKTCFVTAMFAHMFIRLIIQNRFHLLLKNFSIWNSLSDVLSAPLFVATISIHLCCLRRWISSRRSSLQRIFRCHIFPCEDWQFGVLVFAVLFAWEMAWDYTATSFWVAKICALQKKKVFFILDKTKPRNHIELS